METNLKKNCDNLFIPKLYKDVIHSSALSEQTNRKHSSKNGQVQTLDQKIMKN